MWTDVVIGWNADVPPNGHHNRAVTWRTLSPHARRISRHIVCDRGEAVIGAGINHPRRAERERIRDEALAAMDPADAEAYRLKE